MIYVHQYAKASFDYLCSFLTRRPIHIPLWGKITTGVAGLTAITTVAVTALPVRSQLKEGEVYVLSTETSKCYHLDKKCWTLRNSQKNLKIVTLEEAEQKGKRPCSKCAKESTR